MARADESAAALSDWVDSRNWITHLARDPATRSNTSVCLRIVDPQVTASDQGAAFAKNLTALLEAEGIAYDIGSYRDAPPGLRIWCGCTVEPNDIVVLTEWLDWAYDSLKTEHAAG
jgi:phosphoserine aminotransferase apoenzyme (EC 2.6.1.52)